MNLLPETFFKSLSDATRVRCLVLLQNEQELCVCEITYALDEPQPKVSRHLAQLREVGVVRDRRHGLWIFYRINPELPEWARSVLAVTAEGVAAQGAFAGDRQRLEVMPNRPGRQCCPV